jgi:hypothetical protein
VQILLSYCLSHYLDSGVIKSGYVK